MAFIGAATLLDTTPSGRRVNQPQHFGLTTLEFPGRDPALWDTVCPRRDHPDGSRRGALRPPLCPLRRAPGDHFRQHTSRPQAPHKLSPYAPQKWPSGAPRPHPTRGRGRHVRHPLAPAPRRACPTIARRLPGGGPARARRVPAADRADTDQPGYTAASGLGAQARRPLEFALATKMTRARRRRTGGGPSRVREDSRGH